MVNLKKEPDTRAQRKKKKKRTPVCHSIHSFEWSLTGKKATTTTCNKLGTVKNSLRRSSLFRQLEENNKHKELVVVRNNKPIALHFPCTLIKPGEQLIVRYTKASGPKQPMAPLRSSIRFMDQLVEFNVYTTGGKNITRILKNPTLKSYPVVTVYGYKGEKVKHALERDSRFLNTVFDTTCVLSASTTNVEMSNLVNDLDGKTFQIIKLNKNNPPDSQPSSLEESFSTEDSHSSDVDLDENDNEVNNELESHLTQNKQEMHEIPDSKELRSLLLSYVKDSLNCVGQDSDVRGQCLEYGRSQGCFTTDAMTTLMTSLKHSVCQVRVNNNAVGSGFLLFDTFALTNYHVIQDATMNGQLCKPVTVDFSFERLGEASEGHQVQEIVAYEYYTDQLGNKCDWALLSLTAHPKLPLGLLPYCGFLPQSGTICIIGHPYGGVKKVDPTSIIPVNQCNQIIARHYNENLKDCERVLLKQSGQVVQFVSSSFIKQVAKEVNGTRDLSYETCFYFGSSGSPVFDSDCNVVAMHSGGYPYKLFSGEDYSVIEYGHPLISILENLIVQLVHRNRLDVLQKYLDFPFEHHKAVFDNVKKVVDSRNDTKFKMASNNCNVFNDDTLKKFFEFICKTDPPIPMDIGSS